MREALRCARAAADMGEVPVGCVIERDGAIIATGHNRRQTDDDPTAHAEIIAIRQAARVVGDWRLERCTLAVTLEPCPMCAGAIVNARIPTLVYGAADPKMGCVNTLHELCTDPRMNHRVEVVPGVMAEDCAELLRAFFRARRGQA